LLKLYSCNAFNTIRVVTLCLTIGLLLNENKCEIVINDNNLFSSIQAIMPIIMHISMESGDFTCFQ